MPNKSDPVPPTSRRSARQQRLASREANRQLARAGTRSSGGADIGSLALWTVAAVVVGAIVIGGAFLLTQKPSAGSSLASPIAPRVVVPSDIPTEGMTLGRSDAPVTLDLYSDYQCPGCQTFALETTKKLLDDYVRAGKIKIVLHDFIVVDRMTGGTESIDASNAAACAKDQGKFWPMHDWLFANQFGEGIGSYTKDRLKYIGAQIGLDTGAFNRCVDDGQHVDEIKAASDAVPDSVTATPSVVVAGKLVTNSLGANYSPSYDDIKAAIEAALNPQASPSPSASPSAS